MTRKKVRLQYIANDSERKASFKKRKKGFLKKVSELSTLCGVDACAIVYSPFDRDAEVWPSPLGVQRVLARFRRMSDMEQNRKMVNQETFTRNRIKKGEEQLRKLQRENRRKEVGHIINQCLAGMRYQNYNVMDLNDMGYILNQNIRELTMRIESLKAENPPPPQGLMTTSSEMCVGESSNQVSMAASAAENTQNEMQNFQWMNMDTPTPPSVQQGIGMGWDDTPLPFVYNINNDAPGPSFSYPQLND